jgi:thiosulfate/3-mercaptopyruvate sulfurtransferase
MDASAALSANLLVDHRWLAASLDDPRLRVVEVDVTPANHNDWHIDGAVLWNVYADLKDSEYRTVGAEAFQQLVTRSGINADSTVVFYGYAPALGLWLMKLFGHRDVRILDCSRDTWRAEGHPSTAAVEQPSPGTFRLHAADPGLRADLADVRAAIDSAGTTLVDVRTPAEYSGECFWPSGSMQPDGRAGRVPSAVRQPVDDLRDPDGAFHPEARLRSTFLPLLEDDGELITYCTVGGRAATAWFVLTHLLGRDGVRVYDGSWAEWGRSPGTPVAIG